MCNFPVCCRDNGKSSFAPIKEAQPAGKWGDYKCDVPFHTMKHMFDFIAKNIKEWKIDFITWVGDNGVHNVYDYSQEEVAGITRNITRELQHSLKDYPELEFFPTIGNHDTWPVNVQDFSKPNNIWTVNHFKETW